MDLDREQLASLFPNLSQQMRIALSSLYLASTQAIPSEAREKDAVLDEKASVLDQGFYRLLQLVNSLSAAEMLVSETPLSMRDVDLAGIVARVCEGSADLAELCELELRFSCVPERLICYAAEDAIEQMLYRLLSNAFKFTPAGGRITVDLKKKGETVLLSVTDTGRGIEKERLGTLFSRYLQPPRPDAPVYGLGLGLPLCRVIAEKHGGSILAESRVGKGSRFTVSLPYRVSGGRLSDVPPRYHSGFNRALLGLADALPAKAFRVRALD